MGTKLNEVEAAKIERILGSEAGIAALTAMATLFIDVREETFAEFDQFWDSKAESDAAKKGWAVAVEGMSSIALFATLKTAVSKGAK